MTGSSPAAVLRSIAHRLGCSYADIESVINEKMGGKPIVAVSDADVRLDAIRKKLMTPEGECVVKQAARMIAKT
jgi:hypothetical protein